MQDKGIVVNASTRAIVRVLVALTLTLVLLSVAGQYVRYVLGHANAGGFVHQFYLSEDNNVATYFASLLHLFAAGLLYFIGRWERAQAGPMASRWLLLSGVFVALSIEEAVRFSFLVDAVVRQAAASVRLPIFPELLWFSVMAGLAVRYVPFLRRLSRPTRLQFVLAALLFVPAGRVFEYTGRMYGLTHGYENLVFGLLGTAEEAVEMAGILIFIRALLVYLGRNVRYAGFTFSETATERLGAAAHKTAPEHARDAAYEPVS